MLFRFKLTYDGNTTTVEQPGNFDGFESEINRDFNAHGVMYQFVSGDLKLRFVGTGRAVFINAYDVEGLNAVVSLQIEKRPNEDEDWQVIFTGNSLMDTHVKDIDYFEVDFENVTFQSLIMSRMKTKVRLNASNDLDGNALSGSITSQSDAFNEVRKTIKLILAFNTSRDSGVKTDIDETIASQLSPNSVRYWLPDFEDVVDDSNQTNVRVNGGTDFTQTTEPGAGDYFFIAKRGGDITFNGVLKYQFVQNYYNNDPGNPTTQVIFRYTFKIKHFDQSGNLITTYDRNSSGLTNWGETTTSIGGDLGDPGPLTRDWTLQTVTLSDLTISSVTRGDRFVFYMESEILGTSSSTDHGFDHLLDFYHNSITTTATTTEPTTNTVKHYLIFDVLERVTQIITGVNSAFWSDFYALTVHGAASNGCGGLLSLTNGAQLRGIDNDLELSLFDILSSLQAIHNIGWSIEDAYNGVDYRLRVEPMEFFYSDQEIMDIGDVVEFQSAPYEPLMFNRVEIGYDKFSLEENEEGSIDDFATEAEYSTPLRFIDDTYKRKSKFIASQELIQETFLQNDDLTKNWKYDDSIFMVLLVISGSDYIPENDENFASTSGVDFPATAYNLRIAPVYMLVNHSLLINSSLHGVDIVDNSMINTSVRVNKNFSARIDPSFACKLKDSAITRTSTGDILISNMFNGLRLFEPNKHTFKVGLSTSQLDSLVMALTGNLYSGANFGYIAYTDEEGNIEEGYPLNIKWNPVSEIATFECIERSDGYLI